MFRFYRSHYAPQRSLALNWLVYAGIATKTSVYLAASVISRAVLAGSTPPEARLQWAAVSVAEPRHRVRTRDATLSGRVSTDLSDLVRFRHLIWYMAMSSLAVESRGNEARPSVVDHRAASADGRVHAALQHHLPSQAGTHYPLVVLAAILAFEFFARSVAFSMSMLKTAQSSMVHVAFPRTVVPLAVTLSETIRFVISMAAFIGIAAVFGVLPKPAAALAVPFMVIEILFTLGASYFFAAQGIFFRDLTKITEYLFWILFQLGCGMFTLSMIPAKARTIVLFNPFTTFFEGVRAPLLYGTAPDLPFAVVSGVAVLSVLVLVGGYLYFLRREGSFGKLRHLTMASEERGNRGTRPGGEIRPPPRQKARTLRRSLAAAVGARPGAEQGHFWALRDVDFSIAPGEILGVIGKNGAGKSTLLEVIADIISPDEGAVQVSGRRPTLLTIGAGFERELTGRENIRLNAAYLGFSRKEIDQMVEPIEEFSELGHFLDQPLKTYSTGMTARLGFSIAVHTDPDILLLDEVLSVGDADFQAKSQQRLSEMMNRARAIVVVSHAAGFIEDICTKALWLEKGRVRRLRRARNGCSPRTKSTVQPKRPAIPAGQQAAVAPIR